MTNLEAFNLITAQVFAACYIAFPVEENFDLNNIELNISPKEKTDIFIYTMRWLERYDWITIGTKPLAPMFLGVQLTEKALYVLNWMPETLEHDRPLGQRMKNALAEQATAGAVGALVGEAVKAFFRPGAQAVH